MGSRRKRREEWQYKRVMGGRGREMREWTEEEEKWEDMGDQERWRKCTNVGSACQLPRHQSWQNLACETRLTMFAYVSNLHLECFELSKYRYFDNICAHPLSRSEQSLISDSRPKSLLTLQILLKSVYSLCNSKKNSCTTLIRYSRM